MPGLSSQELEPHTPLVKYDSKTPLTELVLVVGLSVSPISSYNLEISFLMLSICFCFCVP